MRARRNGKRQHPPGIRGKIPRMATTYMLVRNRVRDFERWRAALTEDREAHAAAGLTLKHVWRDRSEPNNFWFVFEVASVERAQAFIDDPESEKKGERAGVIDGEYAFVDDAGLYSS